MRLFTAALALATNNLSAHQGGTMEISHLGSKAGFQESSVVWEKCWQCDGYRGKIACDFCTNHTFTNNSKHTWTKLILSPALFKVAQGLQFSYKEPKSAYFSFANQMVSVPPIQLCPCSTKVKRYQKWHINKWALCQ